MDPAVWSGGSWNYGARDVRCTDRGLYISDTGARILVLDWFATPDIILSPALPDRF